MNERGPCAISKQAAERRASDSHYQPLPYLRSDFICKDALKTSQLRKHAIFISPRSWRQWCILLEPAYR